MPTASTVWRGADWLERETYDMYGIRFDGHPDLRRIYLYEEFEGHPLRKDYPKERRQPLVGRAELDQRGDRRSASVRDTDAGRSRTTSSATSTASRSRSEMGPSHPATHGTVRILLKLDGETIVDADVQVGYLHRGFEKECESGDWYQAIPYTDRLNYASPMINNVGYCLAAEKLFGVDGAAARPVPARDRERDLAHRATTSPASARARWSSPR